MSDCCLTLSEEFFHLYHGKNKIDVMAMMMSALNLLQTFYAPVSVVTDHICGVMVNMLVSSAVDHEFEHRCGQAKNYKTGGFFFIAKHTALRSKGNMRSVTTGA
jgi:hypothetical protein